MRWITRALTATLAVTCAHAQQAPKQAQTPSELDPVHLVFVAGEHLGMAEALAEGCETAVVDPQKKQGATANLKDAYRETFRKGFALGWREAREVARKMEIKGTFQQKFCLLGLTLYGPNGTSVKDLIVLLRTGSLPDPSQAGRAPIQDPSQEGEVPSPQPPNGLAPASAYVQRPTTPVPDIVQAQFQQEDDYKHPAPSFFNRFKMGLYDGELGWMFNSNPLAQPDPNFMPTSEWVKQHADPEALNNWPNAFNRAVSEQDFENTNDYLKNVIANQKALAKAPYFANLPIVGKLDAAQILSGLVDPFRLAAMLLMAGLVGPCLRAGRGRLSATARSMGLSAGANVAATAVLAQLNPAISNEAYAAAVASGLLFGAIVA